jgi:uncharacterized protein
LERLAPSSSPILCSEGPALEPHLLIHALSTPGAYPFPVSKVEVRQTHISIVFLAGDFVYKVKKPVAFDFLDFSTLEKRRSACDQEVALNRRLAPDVYLRVVPITRTSTGLRFEGDVEAVEWAVKMRRLPDDATLLHRLERGMVSVSDVEQLATRVAAFHATAEGGTRIASFGCFEVVLRNARDNFTQAEPMIGHTVSRVVFDRLRLLTELALERLRPLIDARARRGVPRDTHGDLHLDHVYLFPDTPPPGDLVVIDCIEFSEVFRYADPVADMAFLFMDLAFHGRRDLARSFADAYFRAVGEDEGRALLPFYSAYRAVVRAKVEGLKSREPEVSRQAREEAFQEARAHWLFALGELEDPGSRPCLVLVGGLPGTGKSTLSARLAERLGFRVIRSDVVRKELAGLSGGTPTGFEAGIYTPEATEKTYAECRRRAEELLVESGHVIVDATFGREANRRSFLDTAARLGLPGVFLCCQASPTVVRDRLDRRQGDVSDADWEVHRRAAEKWEPPGPATARVSRVIDTTGETEVVVERSAQELLDLLTAL